VAGEAAQTAGLPGVWEEEVLAETWRLIARFAKLSAPRE